jgi:hypothetical protein
VTCNCVSLLSNLLRLIPCFRILPLTLFVLILIVPVLSHAGEDPRKPYALIAGTVWGPNDRPVYGVRVKIRRADQKRAKWELYSDHQGEFAQRLPAGKADYIVWADLKGFKSMSGKELSPGEQVTVHIEGDERQDIGLHLK